MSAFDDKCPPGQCSICWNMGLSEYFHFSEDYEEVILDGAFGKAKLLHLASHLVGIVE